MSETRMKLLPPELEMNILSRLPVKSLLRFRCVSKEWLRLLTLDTHFINNMHLPRSLTANSTNPNPSLISLNLYGVTNTGSCYLSGDYVKPIYLDLPIYNNDNIHFENNLTYKCVGICNGLVCLALYRFTPDKTLKLFVWNPLTRDYITLSCLPIPSLPHPPGGVIFGFGFHRATNEYKVVRILSSLDYTPFVSVYTLGTKTWRTLRRVVSYDFGFYNFPITINGAPHWLVTSFESEYELILTFDVEHEVFQEIPFPVSVEKEHSEFYISELGGLLCLGIESKLEEVIEMWVMKEHGVASSWTKLFNIELSEIPEQCSLWNPIGVASNGEITFRSNYDEFEMRFLIYNPKTNSFKGPTKFGHFLYRVFVFAGSLVSPKVIMEEHGRSHLPKKFKANISF